jgi:hypothetical protein
MDRHDESGPTAARRLDTKRLSGRGFWWLWSLALAAAGAGITVWAEQWFQRGVPMLVGVLGGFIVGAIEASVIQRRLGKHAVMASAPQLIWAGAGTVLSLALLLSAAILPSIGCAIGAVLCAASVGVFLARACRGCDRLDPTTTQSRS